MDTVKFALMNLDTFEGRKLLSMEIDKAESVINRILLKLETVGITANQNGFSYARRS